MKYKDDKVYIGHMIEAIDHIKSFTKGITYKEFLKSELIQSAVIRKFEIIGEATTNISK